MFYKTINTKQTYPFMSDFVGYLILREDLKKTDYLETLILFPLTPTTTSQG